MANPVFCVDCKHFNARLARCDRPAGTQTNLVTGTPDTIYYRFSANLERTKEGGVFTRNGVDIQLCGQAGQFFEAKTS